MIELEQVQTILNRTKDSSWFGTDYMMNLYRGCCHGCIYCDSRSACYGVEEFDRVRGKQRALEILRNELRRKVRTGVVGTGSMSDPYNPFERSELYTRHALELLGAFGFGVTIVTKSDLITRDADLLLEIAQQSPVLCKLTITTCDEQLCAKVEPHAPSAAARLAAIGTLREAGLFAGVVLMPVLPFLEDSNENVLTIVREAAAHGARFIYPAFGMTLRENQRDWYYDRLDERFPGEGLRERYMARYGTRYTCTSTRVRTLWKVFTEACDRAGLLYRMEDIVSAYKQGYGPSQLSFF